QSAIDRELVLRLASLLWRLRRATTMQPGLFEVQANHLKEFRQARQALPASRDGIYKLFGWGTAASRDFIHTAEAVSELNATGCAFSATIELTRCFLRLANLPNFALD